MMAFENVQIQLIDTPAVTLDAAQGWLPSLFHEADGLLLIVDLSQDPNAQAEDLLSRLARWRILPLLTGRREEAPFSVSKGMLLLANKRDLPGAEANLEALKGRLEVPLIGLSALHDPDLDPLKKEIFNLLRILRVYPKTPGKEADLDSPVILPRGSTVEGFAESIHKELRRDLKFARIWGSAKFDGQRVSRDYVLQDQDIVELHS
jgi:ribosome-interacting GTPase 1